MTNHPIPLLLALASLLPACTISNNSSDDTDGVCAIGDAATAADCDADCDAVVAGNSGDYACTMTCDTDSDCDDSDLDCVALSDGSDVCLGPCTSDDDCQSDEYCESEIGACLPGEGESTGDGECVVANVTDADSCDVDCDVAVAGVSDVYECTVACDVDAQDCTQSGKVCAALSSGEGACLDDCWESAACPDSLDYCDADLYVCLPQSVD